jgi:hypothetical protein
MSSLVLEKNFGTLFDNDEFSEDKMRYLMVKVRTSGGNIVKKKGKVIPKNYLRLWKNRKLLVRFTVLMTVF